MRYRDKNPVRDFRSVEKCGKLTRACRQVCVQISGQCHKGRIPTGCHLHDGNVVSTGRASLTGCPSQRTNDNEQLRVKN
jgi:hypothetical protein